MFSFTLKLAYNDFKFSYGYTGIQSGDTNSSLKLVVEAAENSPNNGFYSSILCDSYFLLADQMEANEISKKALDTSIRFCNKADDIFNKRNGHIKVLLGRAYSLYYQRYQLFDDKAKNAFDEAIVLSPLDPDLYVEFGKYYYYKNDFRSAIDQFEYQLSISPIYWKYKNDENWLSNEPNAFKYRMFIKANPFFYEMFEYLWKSYDYLGNKDRSGFYKQFD